MKLIEWRLLCGDSTVKRKFTNLGDDVVANGHNFDAAKILSISIFKKKKKDHSPAELNMKYHIIDINFYEYKVTKP